MEFGPRRVEFNLNVMVIQDQLAKAADHGSFHAHRDALHQSQLLLIAKLMIRSSLASLH
jgi:hypothetical protein